MHILCILFEVYSVIKNTYSQVNFDRLKISNIHGDTPMGSFIQLVAKYM